MSETGGRPRALVTGASSGIGQAFAERLGREGYDLIIVARRRDRLERLAQQLREKQGITAEVLAADLTQPADLHFVEKLVAEDPGLEFLVNNAGFGGYMPFVQLDPDQAEQLIRLMVVAVTRLTRALLPAMIARGRGTIVNVSSLLAFSAPIPAPPLPYRATYAATKAYLNTFTEILHSELTGTGVRVQAVCPGTVRTEFHERTGTIPRLPPESILSPEAVAEASIAGLRLGEVICVPSLEDPRLLTQYRETQQRILQGAGRRGALAERYLQ